MHFIAVLVGLLTSMPSFATSAVRLEGQEWSDVARSHRSSNKDFASTVEGNARKWSNQWLYLTTRWNDYELQEWFRELRDDRFLSWSGQRKMNRRLTWLYPHDGCYARANMMVRQLRDKDRPIPQKIFAFGNLWYQTPYSATGKVGWWYHVAPIVDVGGTGYVLDPSVDPYRPLLVSEWLARMGNPNNMKIAICGAGAYMPNNECNQSKVRNLGKEPMLGYMNKEWDTLQQLGHSPEQLLGDRPPWY